MLKYDENNYKLYLGDNQEEIKSINDNSIDSIITDPPYEINFMGRGWDNSGIAYNIDLWKQCLRVLKPGGILLCFGSPKTFHRVACAIEDSGFILKDTIMWIYGSGFIKGANIALNIDKRKGLIKNRGDGSICYASNKNNKGEFLKSGTQGCPSYEPQSEEAKEFEQCGTCLKPAYEPIIVAIKPFEKSIVDNVLKYKCGCFNLKDTRIGNQKIVTAEDRKKEVRVFNSRICLPKVRIGRVAANIMIDKSANIQENWCSYFYGSKASTKDRDEGLEDLRKGDITDGRKTFTNLETNRIFGGKRVDKRNIHPTVKPTDLMQYLVRLVNPNKNAVILDLFCGSGSTGKAVMYENKERNVNYTFIGIEKEEKYLEIAKKRIDYAAKEDTQTKLNI